MHKTVKANITIDDVEQVIDCVIGVKQWDVLGLELLIFVMAEVLKTWRSSNSYKWCTLRCKTGFQLSRRKLATKGDTEINILDSEYANDTAFTFDSREECEIVTPLIIKHFAHWGLKFMSVQRKKTPNQRSCSSQKVRDVTQILQTTMAMIYSRFDGKAVSK